MKTVELIYINAGGGHRAAAMALQEAMRLQARPWRVVLTNLTDVLDPGAKFQRWTGRQPEDLYNMRLESGFTLGLAQELKLLQALIRWAHPALVQRLGAHWNLSQPDLVVSLIPNFNRALCQSLMQVRSGVPFVTVLTDMADHPPHFWAEPDLPQQLVCGTGHAVAQALGAGCDPARVHRVNGMILRPDFYDPANRPTGRERGQARRALGLPEQAPVGLVLFGGHGSNAMKRIAQRLADVPLILLCGRNEALAQALREQPASAPRVVLGFTPDIARWMALADFFIGKPGPGSLSEAVHMGLPVIVTRNASTMPQERWNTVWVHQHGLGVVHRSFRDVRVAVDELLADLPGLQHRVQCMSNRALFEVPELLAGFLAAAQTQKAPVAPLASLA